EASRDLVLLQHRQDPAHDGQLEPDGDWPKHLHVDEIHWLGSGRGRGRRCWTAAVGRIGRLSVVELSANPQFHGDALLQVLIFPPTAASHTTFGCDARLENPENR